MNQQWAVIWRKEWTQSQTRPAEFFSSREDAEKVAYDFNRFSTDRSWNAEVAVVHNLLERLRA